MGWKMKLSALFLGVVLFEAGAWPLGLICLIYLALSVWPRRSGNPIAGAARTLRTSVRQGLALMMLILSAVAFASGGVFSPFVFLLIGVALFSWPSVLRRLPLTELVPQEDSILLRSKYTRLSWSALAEVKPGAEEFSRAVSSFGGRLLAFTDTGRVFSIATCSALSRKEAEAKILEVFRRAAPSGNAGAFLFPLDSKGAVGVIRLKLSKANFPLGRLAESASRISGAIVLDCDGGRVLRASVSDIDGPSSSPRLPAKPEAMVSPPLAWEIFESVGKRTRWPQPDSLSNLLDSMLATKGVPLAERVREFQTSGDLVKIRTLSGEDVQTSRAQLRALVSVYS